MRKADVEKHGQQEEKSIEHIFQFWNPGYRLNVHRVNSKKNAGNNSRNIFLCKFFNKEKYKQNIEKMK